jgi:hypothetical protein
VRSANPVSPITASAQDGPEPTLGGWLLVLCLFLAVWQPLNLAIAASNALMALPVRGWPLAVVLAVRVVVTAFGVAGAMALYRRHSGAATLAALALALSLCVDLFVYTTSYVPNNRLPGDTPLYIGWTIALHGAWLLYLSKSARVRRTLRDDDLPVHS